MDALKLTNQSAAVSAASIQSDLQRFQAMHATRDEAARVLQSEVRLRRGFGHTPRIYLLSMILVRVLFRNTLRQSTTLRLPLHC